MEAAGKWTGGEGREGTHGLGLVCVLCLPVCLCGRWRGGEEGKVDGGLVCEHEEEVRSSSRESKDK